MILGCPECETRFAIDAQALRPDGRRVKCGKCSHVWFEEPPSPNAAEPLSVTPLEPGEQSTIPTPNLPAISVADQKRTAGAAWALVAILVAVIVAIGWFGREQIARAWPPAENIYATIGVNALPLPGEGLAIEMQVKEVGEMLHLSGEVENISSETRPLPPMYGVLQDATGKRLRHWQLQVTGALLGPGEKIPFSTQVDTAPGTTNVSVLFTNPADNQ